MNNMLAGDYTIILLSEEWLIRRREMFESLLQTCHLFKSLKMDLKGIGCIDDGSLRRPERKRGRNTGGFGMGVLEEEEEFDVYGEGREVMSTALALPGDVIEEREIDREEEKIRFVDQKDKNIEKIEPFEREWMRYELDQNLIG